MRVLILEDSQTDAELMLHELKRAGFETQWALVKTQSEYYDCLRDDWDVILADYSLPHYNALHALQDLQARDLDIPFIIVTGSISEEVAVDCMKQGASDYLLKDRLARLGSAVQNALEDKHNRDQKRLADADLEERARQIEALHDIAATIAGKLGLGDLLQYIVDQTAQLVGSESCSVLLLDEESGELVFRAAVDEVAGMRIPPEEGVVFRALRSNQPQIVNDLTADPGHYKQISLESGLKSDSILAVPLRADDKAIGVLAALNKYSGDFTQQDSELLVIMANHAAMAIEKAHLYEAEFAARHRAEEHRRYAESIIQTAPAMVITLDENGKIYSFNEFAADLTGYKPQDVIGQNWIEMFIPPSCRERITYILKEVLAGNETFWINENPIVCKDGPQRYVYWQNTLLSDEINQTHTVLSIGIDITDRNRLEQQSQRLLQQQIAANQLSISLGESLELTETYQIIYQHVLNLMDADAFIVSSYDKATQLIHASYVIAEGEEIDVTKFPPIPLEEAGKGTQSQVIRSGKPMNITDFRDAMNNTATEHTITEDKQVVDGPPPEDRQGDSTNSAILVPMKDKGETIGVLQIQSHSLDAYTREDIDLLAALANEAAISIQNARLFNEAHQRLDEMEMVNRISVALRFADTLSEMMPIFLDETLSILNTSSGAIAIYDESAQKFDSQLFRGWFENLESSLPPLRKGISGHVLETGKAYISTEFVSDPLVTLETRQVVPEKWGGACFPVYAGTIVTGIFYVSVEHPRQLTSEEIILLETLAEIVGVAIHRTRLREKTDNQIQRLAALRIIDTTINASLDMNIVTDVLLEQAKTLLNVDAVSLLTLDPYTNVLEHAGCIGFRSDIQKQLQLRVGESFAGKTALTRELTIIPDLPSSGEAFEKPEFVAGEDIVAYFAAPLISKGKVKGVLEALHRTVFHPNKDWIDFFKTLAGQAALAIDNTTLFRDLQKTNLDLALAYDSTLEGWARALEYREKESVSNSRNRGS